MSSPLLQFLVKARSVLFRPPDSPPPPPLTVVLGNPSCDLDSFISATIYSYFHSRLNRNLQSPRLHIPILNLPTTSSGELWRLRPEFGTALKLALHGQEKPDRNKAEDVSKRLLENMITISDIASTPSSPVHYVFSGRSSSTGTTSSKNIPVVLVDHNALSIPVPNLPTSEISSYLNIVGCIDHHVDESTIPTTSSPRIIRTGIGSCTSLVVQYLRDEGYWQDPTEAGEGLEDREDHLAGVELAKLSLASILTDTTNLTAEGKVSDTDRQVVSFLEDIIVNTTTSTSSTSSPGLKQASWDRTAFYQEISASKANSLALLTLPEIFERDYKSWSEKTTSSRSTLNLGVASVVKPVSWLVEKSADASAEKLVGAMEDYARTQGLDVFVVMTTFSSTSKTDSGDGEFRRELLVLGMGEGEGNREEVRNSLRNFEDMAQKELKLDDWSEDEYLVGLLGQEGGSQGRTRGRIWLQRDVSKSRKQVAPLLREAIRRA
jgi:exopolyphosphatase